MKKTISLICTILFITLFQISCGVSDEEMQIYIMGYERGQEDMTDGEESSCQTTLAYMAWRNMAGDQEWKKKFYCEGYEDGYNKRPNKYKVDENPNDLSNDESNSSLNNTDNLNEQNIANIQDEPVMITTAIDSDHAFICQKQCGGSQNSGQCKVCGMDLISNPDYREQYTEQTMYSLVSDSLTSGTFKYCDKDGYWYLIVKIEQLDIIIEQYAGENNDSFQDKTLPKDIIKGKINEENLILTKDNEGQMRELYKISKGVLYEAAYEGTQNEYKLCP